MPARKTAPPVWFSIALLRSDRLNYCDYFESDACYLALSSSEYLKTDAKAS